MRRALPWAAVAVLVLAVLVAGWLSPVRPASVRSDGLGPDSGELVADYLARADASLADAEREPDAPHWGLISFEREVDTSAVAALPGQLRIAQVLFRVPIDRVQTPLVPVAVSAHPEALRKAPLVAAGRLRLQSSGPDRAARIAAVSADRLAAGCACVVGVAVRGTAAQLRAAADDPAVRAVEVLPSDAVAGRFSLIPLLPEHAETVVPGPDDAEP